MRIERSSGTVPCLDAPPAPQPHWTDSDEWVTLIVSLDAGASGAVTIDGHEVSEAAATNLAAAGFVQLLRRIVDRDGPTTDNPATDDPATDDDSPEPAAPAPDAGGTE